MERTLANVVVAVGLVACTGCCSTMNTVGERGDSGQPGSRTDECGNGVDDDGNGRIDDGCPCGAGETQACFTGARASRHVGACTDGVQTCTAVEWGDWGDSPCVGGTAPSAEECDGLDHDCDGARNEDCPCTAGMTQECGVEFLTAPCRGGTQTCRADGTWSGCDGAVGPMPDVCDGVDNDCDGTPDEGCGCVPVVEICRDGIDNDCDREIDEPACTPDWPPCASGVPATGSDWTVEATPTPAGATLNASRVAVDTAGNVYVLGAVCSGSATILGVPVTSGAPVVGCNPWLAAFHPDGTLRYLWSGTLRDVAMPRPSYAGPPSANAGALAPDEAGGVWIAGGFRGRYSPMPGTEWEETTDGLASDAFLVHLDATGAVVGALRVGETGTTESFPDVVVTRDGAPVVLGSTSSPILLFGTTIVRAGYAYYIARLDPSLTGAAAWVTVAKPGDVSGHVEPIGNTRMTLDPSDAIVVPGGSNGNVLLGATPITSTDPTRGHAWLWTISAADGSTLGLRTWQSASGYYAHAQRARVTSDGVGFAGWLRGEIDFGSGTLACGTGLPEDPFSPFLVTTDPAFGPPAMGRVFPPMPFDAFHGFGSSAVDWTSCLDTVLVANGSAGRAPDTRIDFGAGAVSVPAGRLQLVEWDHTGALNERLERSVNPAYRVRDIALSPREHVVYVAGDYTLGFTTTLSIRRYAL